jgi:hypothetical protein
MKHPRDDEKSKTKKPPVEKTTDGKIVQFRKPKPGKPLDVEWFYEDEEFFSEHMDEFDW